MKEVQVFVVDDNNEVVQDNRYNVIKILKENQDMLTMFVVDFDGDFSIIRALKDYSVIPYRLTVKHKFLLPIFIDEQED